MKKFEDEIKNIFQFEIKFSNQKIKIKKTLTKSKGKIN